MEHTNIEARTIGQALASVSTVSQPLSERYPTEDREIVAPTTPEEARALRQWAETQPRAWPAIEVDELTRHLEFMSATLPTKNLDEESGRKRVAVYARILGGYSEHAIAKMALVACSTLRWFPTPSECLEIIAKHEDPPTPRERALTVCHGFAQRQFEAFRASLKAGDASAELLDGVPDQWKRICVEQGYLRWSKADGFTIEPRYAARTTTTGGE